MAEAKRTVRLIRTYHVEVPAVYGDTDETIKAKATAALDAQDKAGTLPKPEAETLVLLPYGKEAAHR